MIDTRQYPEYEVHAEGQSHSTVSQKATVEYEVQPQGWSGALSEMVTKEDISIAGFEVEFVHSIDLMPVDLITVREGQTNVG